MKKSKDKNYKVRKLTKSIKEMLSHAPNIYKKQYVNIVGKTTISSSVGKLDVFVMTDGRLMTVKQPFCMRTEKDWQPKYFEDEKEAAKYISKCWFRYVNEAENRTKERYCVAGPQLDACAPFYLCSTKDAGWFIAFASIQPSNWFVYSIDEDNSGFFELQWDIPGYLYYVGSLIELKDGRTVLVREIKKSEGRLNNPLLRLEFVDTGIKDKDAFGEMDTQNENYCEDDDDMEFHTATEWGELGYVPRNEDSGVVFPDGTRIYEKCEVFSPMTRRLNLKLTGGLKMRGEGYSQRNKFLELSRILNEDRKTILSGCNNDPITFISLMTDNVCTIFGRNLMDTASIAEYFANVLFAPTGKYYGEPNQHKAIFDGWGIAEEERCLEYRNIISKHK